MGAILEAGSPEADVARGQACSSGLRNQSGVLGNGVGLAQ